MKSASSKRLIGPASPAGMVWTGCLAMAVLVCSPPVRSADFGERTPSVNELISALSASAIRPEVANTLPANELPDGVRTRGLKIVSPSPTGSAAATTGTAASQADGTGGTGRVSMSIQFDLNSDRIHKASADSLANLAAALSSSTLRDRRFEVVGHTDITGPQPYNLKLSERRAKSVAEFLAAVGVEPTRAKATGRGPAEPLTDVAPDSALQRRVEIKILND